ncbi:MAG TPA: ABC transporter permease, partial [Gemmatimonadaceae bacterium]|nr:ABC transporter permease [Gemmatimonadaceae bacterium]
DDELRFHLEMRARDYELEGLPPEAAARAARERFGDPERIGGILRSHDERRERERHRREFMSELLQDLRYGWRGLLRSPGFTIVAVLTLALGIGATTAIFSVVDAVVLRPLPYPDAERITMVWMDNQRMGMHEDIHSWPNYAAYRDQNHTFTDIAAYVPAGFNLTGACDGGACEPERVVAAASTADLFAVLGVGPRLGRAFTAAEEEPGSDDVAVISHGLWTRLFAGDPGVIGRTIRLNGRERTVVGVMPPGFAFPSPETQLWVPLAMSAEDKAVRFAFGLYAVGRRAPGVSLERARADMATIAQRLVAEYPGMEGLGVNLVPLPDQVVGKTLRTALWVMLGAVAAVLLIGCANIANLMLSRAAAREREVGVRLALGAGRGRLVRQLLTESVLLAAIGGVVGVALAWVGLRLIVGLAPADMPRMDGVRIDGFVLAVAALVVLATGLIFGLAPALQLSRPDLAAALREGGRGGTGQRGHRMRRLLAGAQVALVVVLLTGAGLLMRSFVQLQQVQLGFRPDHLLTMQLALPAAKYQEPQQRLAFYQALLERLRTVPGVQGVGAITDIFLSNTPRSTVFTIEGRTPTPEEENIEIPLDAVTADYFRTMGIRLLEGRTFTAQDGPDAPPVVIVNENMARRFWPGESAIGKRFRYGTGDDNPAPWLTIVGVVADMRRTGYDKPVRYETFLPIGQYTPGRLTFVVRTVGEPLALARAVRAEVRHVDPDQPVYQLESMDQRLSAMVAQRRFSMALLGMFAGLALVLGLVGVYGVTSYLVAQRTREVGLRLALGAEPRSVVRMVIRQGMTTAAAGIGVGLVGALLATRLMAGLLYGVRPGDAATLAAVTALLAAATFVANYLPARRASRVDPLVALREE